MNQAELLRYFLEHYYPKKEITYRLPVSCPIAAFWPEVLRFRRERAVMLPLRTASGEPYWYVPTEKLLRSGDALALAARERDADEPPQPAHEDGMEDEAFYSSAIEGAYSTREEARRLIRSGKTPETKDERMIVNNYEALRFVLDHLDTPINEAVVLEIARILTEGTLEEGTRPGWRDAGVNVVSGRQEIVYAAPDAGRIRPMLDDLLAFIADEDVHPVIKACVAHIDFVTIHPLFDGNGRTARALSYMILLQAGYGFFRGVPISGLLVQERTKYYKAIRASQDPANGNDFTYFMEYYADMLLRSLSGVHSRMDQNRKLEALRAEAASLASADRLCAGMESLYRQDEFAVTTETWKDRLNVSFETARQDLLWLTEHGYLAGRTVGHKKYFDVVRDK